MDLPGGRRPAALAGLAVLVVAAADGALLLTAPADRPLDSVPADVDYVGHLDAEAMRADPGVANATRAAFRFQSRVVVYDGPPFRASFAVGESPLNGSRASRVTYFGRSNGSAYAARIVRANWTEHDLVGAVESSHGVELTATGQRGVTVYVDRDDTVAVAVLPDDRYVVGNATAVRDAVDVARGDAPSVSGGLRRELERQRPSYARFAYRFDPSSAPALPFIGPTIERVRIVSAGYYVNDTADDRMGVRVNVTTESESTARSIEGMLTLGARYYDRSIEDPARAAVYEREMAKVEFESDGQTALVRYETSPAGLRDLLAVLSRV